MLPIQPAPTRHSHASAVAVAAALLWGLIEFSALLRARFVVAWRRHH